MKYLMIAAALCFGTMSAQAQTQNTKATAPAARNCVVSTTDKGWSDLGLTADQTTKVKSIQSECMKASEKMKADNMQSKESPMMNKYEDEVKKVLTPAQYEKWVKECSTHAAKPMDSKMMEEKAN